VIELPKATDYEVPYLRSKSFGYTTQMTYAEGEAHAQKIRTRRKIEAVFSVLKRQMPTKIDFVKTSTFLLKIT
jgi:hypothetical protein